MLKFAVLALGLALTACRAGTPAPIYTDTEGPYDPGAPAHLRPSRRIDSSLLQRRVGGLIVQVASLGQPLGRAHIALYPNDVWRDLIREDSTDADGALRFDDLKAGVYSGVVRRVGRRPSLFLVTISAGYLDTLDLRLGWPAR